MTGRGQQESLRLFTQELTREELTALLAALDWCGDLTALDEELRRLEPFSEGRQFVSGFRRV